MSAILLNMLPTVISGGLGFFAKLFSWKIHREQAHKEKVDLITRAGFDYSGYARLQSGQDTADPIARFCRMIMVLSFTAVWCWTIPYLLIHAPVINMDIMVPVDTPWLGKIFGLTQKPDSKVIEMSVFSLLWSFKSIYEFMVVFHFTKMGK